MNEAELGRTEAVFREVNEAIARTAERYDAHDAEFVCECGDPDCAERVHASLDEYEAVREDGTQFIVADGHVVHEVERVVRRKRGYSVIKKVGKTVREVARRLNPRRPLPPQPSE
ncbi:MAG TPA: hypothetical protein VJP39_07555 [Gaiellaceae bacterium]|nr:hypothetical protein [Gaiellaceae bacterium]